MALDFRRTFPAGLILLWLCSASVAQTQSQAPERVPEEQIDHPLESVQASSVDAPDTQEQLERDIDESEELTEAELVYGAADELEEHPCLDLHPDEVRLIDATRRRLHETLCSASLWFDGLFGEHRNVKAARGAHGRVETSYTYSDFYGNKERVRMDVRVDLPNLEQRFSAFLGRDNEDDFVRDRQEGFALRSQFPSIDDRDEWLGGLGYALPASDRFSTDFRVGVRNLRNPRLFVRSRVRYNAYSDKRNLIHIRMTPFWNTRDRFGITPGIDFSRVLSPTRLLRFSNLGTASQESRGFDWRSALIHYQGLRKGRGIAVEAFIRGFTEAPVSIREYGSRAVYRHPLFSDRLFAELVAGYTWPQELPEEDRRGSALLAFGIEMPFGKTGRRAEDTPVAKVDALPTADEQTQVEAAETNHKAGAGADSEPVDAAPIEPAETQEPEQ